MAGEPEDVKVDASARGPKARHEGTSDSGRDATAVEGGDTATWDTADDPRGRGADWLDKGMIAAGTKGVVEEQGG